MPEFSFVPDLRYFHAINFNDSGGKDSGAARHRLVELATAAGVLDRVGVLHNDLGRVEWLGTRELDAMNGTNLVERFGDRPGAGELVRQQAEHYGLRHVVYSRRQGDLLDHIEERGKFPSSAARYCTSDHKRAPKYRWFTDLVRERNLDEPLRILDVNGERADESPARALKPAFAFDERASNKTKRKVYTWRIIHDWTEKEVWDYHYEHDIPWAWPYDAGMSRLSCAFCVLGSKKDLLTAIPLRPDLVNLYVPLEQKIGHDFKHKMSIASLVEAA